MTMFSIVDIETSGGSPRSDKITEIAIYVIDGNKVIDKFVSLVNPECVIPYHITALTGITNQMVDGAPKFYEIARKIVEITENTVFVAHNVSFDYSFVKREFEILGFRYKREILCTVKLSRKLMPGFQSYSLGKLCSQIGIDIQNRHRAEGDVIATVELFKKLYNIDSDDFYGKNITGFSGRNLNPLLDTEIIKCLPDRDGVYYFYDTDKNLIYIGKSNNIHKRVLSHLNNEKSLKTINMKSEIADIGFELTGNELIALLLESDEIKKHKPRYNRAQRRTIHNWGLYTLVDENGYINFRIDKNTDQNDLPLTSYSNKKKGVEHLSFLCKDLQLCMKLCGLYDTPGACFYHSIGECLGACNGSESAESYNVRASKLLKAYSYYNNNMLIVLNGKHKNEIAVVEIRNGKYLGFGYADREIADNKELLSDSIKPYQDNKDVQQIIRSYLKSKQDYKILNL